MICILCIFFFLSSLYASDCEPKMSTKEDQLEIAIHYNSIGIPLSFFDSNHLPIPRSLQKNTQDIIDAKNVIHEEYEPITILGEKKIEFMDKESMFLEAIEKSGSKILFDPSRNSTIFRAEDVDYANAIAILKRVDFRVFARHLVGEGLRLIHKKEINQNQFFSNNFLHPIFKRTIENNPHFQILKHDKIIVKSKHFDLVTSHPFEKKYSRFNQFFTHSYQELLEEFAINVYLETGVDLVTLGASSVAKPSRKLESVELHEFVNKYELDLYSKLIDWSIKYGLSSFSSKYSQLKQDQSIHSIFENQIKYEDLSSGQFDKQISQFIKNHEIHSVFITPIFDKYIMKRLEQVRTIEWKLLEYMNKKLNLNLSEIMLDQFTQKTMHYGASPGTDSEKLLFSRSVNFSKKYFKSIEGQNILLILGNNSTRLMRELLYSQLKVHGANEIIFVTLAP